MNYIKLREEFTKLKDEYYSALDKIITKKTKSGYRAKPGGKDTDMPDPLTWVEIGKKFGLSADAVMKRQQYLIARKKI